MSKLNGSSLSSQGNFSIVVPIAERDVDLVPRTLPSWLALGSPDIVLCVDRPISEHLRAAIESVAQRDPRVKILEVPEALEWRFRHAFIRREGFREAKFDRILTGDIDIVVNGSCIKAVTMVGNQNVGLVSMSKRRGADTLGEPIRNASKKMLQMFRPRRFFTGLYALYRPYWVDLEDQEWLKGAHHPEVGRTSRTESAYLGEDVMLRNAVAANHTILYLSDIGGTDLRISLEDRAPVQTKLGAKYYRDGKPMGYVLAQSILYARGTLIGTYADLVLSERGIGPLFGSYLSALEFLVETAESQILRRLRLI